MSMNLNCTAGGECIELWQTPSRITYMCVVQNDGSVPYRLVGKKAKHALYIYMQWVKYSTNGVWKSDVELKEAQDNVKEHLAYLQDGISRSKRIEVYVQ